MNSINPNKLFIYLSLFGLMLADISHQEKNLSKKQCQDYEQKHLTASSGQRECQNYAQQIKNPLAISIEKQILPVKECQDYEQGLLSGTSTDLDVITELGAFTKWSTECFGSWFCENANFEAPKNEGKSNGEKQILAQMTKVKGTFCNEIGAGNSMEKAVKSVEDLTKQSINGLKKDLKMQEKIKAIVEQELNKDAQVKGKLMTILNHFKIPSFSAVLEGAFEKLFDQRHEGKCHIPSHQVMMGTGQRRRRKRMHQNGHQQQGQQQQQLALELGVVVPQQQQQNVPEANAQPIAAEPIPIETAAAVAKAALKKFWKKFRGLVIFMLCALSLLICAMVGSLVQGRNVRTGMTMFLMFALFVTVCAMVLLVCGFTALGCALCYQTIERINHTTRVHAVGQPPQTPPPSP